MPAYQAKTCRDCGRLVRWAVKAGHKRIPLDYEPSPEHGTVTVDDRGWAIVWPSTGEALAYAEKTQTLALVYTPHHATCSRYAHVAHVGRDPAPTLF